MTDTAKKGGIKINCWYYCWYRDIEKRAKPVAARHLAVSLLPSVGVTLTFATSDFD